MKIAVTYEEGKVFQHFGHTEHFKFYEVEDGKVTTSQVVDTNGSGHGALAGLLAEHQVDVLICGGIGGVTYCLRGIYLKACVFDRWSDKWLPWYFIRPLVSFVCGVVSCVFLKAGLIVLEAKQSGDPTNLAFFALAFIAGLNVDKFVEKIEDIAQVTWGIKKSRTASKEDDHA